MLLTFEEFETELYRHGRVQGPRLLASTWWGRRIDRETLTTLIGVVWSMAEYPSTALTLADWRGLFDAAGYTTVGEDSEYGARADRPSGSVRVYRGCTPSLRRRWSWTSDRELAVRFAQGVELGGFNGRMPGRLYLVDAPPGNLLCQIDSRRESEYVVDTRGLKTVEETS